ncbi:MAG: glutathione peroxidase [Rhodoferax sp.]|nr:glutathione peroxidase [Rhodoferax sp.]
MPRSCFSGTGWSVVLGVCVLLAACMPPRLALAQAPASGPVAAGSCPAVLQHRFKRLQDEAPQDLCQYAGRVVLVVNTASFCGFTGQYEGLERLFARLGPRGLVVLGFPSNDFGQQEPGNNKQIADFCFNTYAVRFPMFSKTTVVGQGAHPLFVSLARATGRPPAWNFHKYLIDRKGRVLASYASEKQPEAADLVARIEQALAEK